MYAGERFCSLFPCFSFLSCSFWYSLLKTRLKQNPHFRLGNIQHLQMEYQCLQMMTLLDRNQSCFLLCGQTLTEIILIQVHRIFPFPPSSKYDFFSWVIVNSLFNLVHNLSCSGIQLFFCQLPFLGISNGDKEVLILPMPICTFKRPFQIVSTLFQCQLFAVRWCHFNV